MFGAKYVSSRPKQRKKVKLPVVNRKYVHLDADFSQVYSVQSAASVLRVSLTKVLVLTHCTAVHTAVHCNL